MKFKYINYLNEEDEKIFDMLVEEYEIAAKVRLNDIKILDYDFTERYLIVVFNDHRLPYIFSYNRVSGIHGLEAHLIHQCRFIADPIKLKRYELVIDLLKSQK